MQNRFFQLSVLLGVALTATVTAALTTQGDNSLENARRLFPPDVTRGLLVGKIPPPSGFDTAMAERLEKKRFDALRSGVESVTGRDNDAAAVVLLQLKVDPQTLKPVRLKVDPQSLTPAKRIPASRVTVQLVRSEYPAASGKTSGFFKTGQDADLMLSGIDFNNTGGSLLFNHPSGIASDSTRLYLTDTFNNRVLVWNTLPKGNVAPDLVLGQPDFTSNNPGTGRGQLDWPIGVATDGKRVLVLDTNNYRVLIWNSIPTKSGQPADLVLQGGSHDGGPDPSKSVFYWPWGLWTNGEKLVVSSTGGGAVLIWNQFPTKDNQPADILLKGGGKMGTPRQVTSDGKSLIVGDHNARVEGQSERGAFFWKTFPAKDDQPYDFYRPSDQWLRGTFTQGGKLVATDNALRIWNSFPQDASDAPALSVELQPFVAPGDYESMVVAGNALYLSSGNTNKVVVYNSLPTRTDQAPDFAIGSPDLTTNTLETNFIISNPVPASSGKSLFVSSDFDRKLYVWKQLPDESGARPDLVYSLDFGPMDNALWGDTFALAGHQDVMIWKGLPVKGQPPDLVFKDRIGSVQFKNLTGIAMDEKYFFLGDAGANKMYVWNGMPSPTAEPAFSLDVESLGRMSSDGDYLVVATGFNHKALVWPVGTLSAISKPSAVGGVGMFNGVPMAAARGGLYLLDGGFNRVHIWRNIQDALSGKVADVILGANLHKYRPEIGRNTFFLPAALSFDGSYLWVGETKFSERILRFSLMP